ncbi:MAG: hypothetical protein KJO15_11850 [Alphaproteobacteria bacterium]|nr:hypothetical protein [Alphaproteobacteria bacterium]MBT8459689.1 hypothetical protein [Boseongicola sp.]
MSEMRTFPVFALANSMSAIALLQVFLPRSREKANGAKKRSGLVIVLSAGIYSSKLFESGIGGARTGMICVSIQNVA